LCFGLFALALLVPTASGASVDFGGAYLAAPGEADEGIVWERSEAGVDDLSLRVALIIVVALLQDRGYLLVSS
jgi:hypothetical protein